MLGNIIFNIRMKLIRQRGERYKREKRIRDAYAEYWPDKKKRKTSNIVVAISICAIIIYTVASFWITYVRGISMDPTLTTCVYSFFGSELLMLAGIRVSKVVKESYNYEYNSSTETTQDEDAVG